MSVRSRIGELRRNYLNRESYNVGSERKRNITCSPSVRYVSERKSLCANEFEKIASPKTSSKK